MEQDKKWGGKRQGAGRLPKYGEPTINITFRIPISSKEIVANLVKAYLNTLDTNIKRQPSEYGC